MRDDVKMGEVPSGTVTFLFTDVEGSTTLWERDEGRMDVALSSHGEVMRAAFARHGGYVFSTGGDSFAVAFSSPVEAVQAAVEAQLGLADVGIRVRMGLHVGEARERGGDYFGPTVNRAARVMAAAYGGQVLVTGATAELVKDRFGLRDLDEHRLPDVSVPVHLWQGSAPRLEDRFPAVRSAGSPVRLLAEPTSFVGREGDVAGLIEALASRRVVTVAGPGGMGKTRLALRVAAQVAGEFRSVCVADLTPVESFDAVVDVVLTAVGVRRHWDRSPMETLAEACDRRRVLVVLDNCEHVVAAAAELAAAVTAGDGSVVLATSREQLGLPGEAVWLLGPLSNDAAVALVADRAQAVDRTVPVDGWDDQAGRPV